MLGPPAAWQESRRVAWVRRRLGPALASAARSSEDDTPSAASPATCRTAAPARLRCRRQHLRIPPSSYSGVACPIRTPTAVQARSRPNWVVAPSQAGPSTRRCRVSARRTGEASPIAYARGHRVTMAKAGHYPEFTQPGPMRSRADQWARWAGGESFFGRRADWGVAASSSRRATRHGPHGPQQRKPRLLATVSRVTVSSCVVQVLAVLLSA